jgi:broad specificity phosphatase PhoE
MTGVVWLVRHAATDRTGTRWTGWRSDPPLSDAGRRAADALAARLGDRLPMATPVISSPSRRAVDTARPIAARLGTEVDLDPDLREADVGDVDGLTFDEAAARQPELARRLLAAEREIDWPGGELAANFASRVAAVVGRLPDGDGPGDALVIVSHGGLIAELLASIVDGSVPAEDRWLPAASALALRRHGGAAWAIVDRIRADGT